jgi:inhibitor of KinA
MMEEFRLVLAGDSMLIVEFDERIDPAVNARAVGVAAGLSARALPGIRDIVPTFRSTAIYFDPLRTDVDGLTGCLRELASGQIGNHGATTVEPIRVPVCYGGDLGPDLAGVARMAGLHEAEVIALHAGTTYHVFMLGFVPGFPYMGTVPPRIAVPRREAPRARVPAGSVGIAGPQTGIYPSETPGGWQLIGRTPVMPFDLSRAEPFLLKAGDAVQFIPMTREEFDRTGRPSRAAS